MVYVIGAVPTLIPPTTPEAGFMVAIDVAPLVHVPPATASASVVFAPTQTVVVPVMTAGVGLTVNEVVVVAAHAALKPAEIGSFTTVSEYV